VSIPSDYLRVGLDKLLSQALNLRSSDTGIATTNTAAANNGQRAPRRNNSNVIMGLAC
jgi:hypothetical protein